MARDGDPAELNAAEAVAAIRAGKLTSFALVEALAERIEKGKALNAVLGFDRDIALVQAQEYDALAKQGRPLGPLHGLPILVKDNVHVAGFPNAAGTPALKDFHPKRHAPVTQKLVDAGAFVIGKANMHELAFGITSNNAYFGAVGCAYDAARFAGGSSGGSGTAVAARMAPVALGTDTGGSVRIPAALNGVIGLRPSSGRYPIAGITPISTTRDTPGPLTRSVADAALIDGVIADGPLQVAPASIKGLRLGVEQGLFWKNIDTEVARVCENALKRLVGEGAEIVTVSMPRLGEFIRAAFPIALYETPRALTAYLKSHVPHVTLEDLVAAIASPDVKEIFDQLMRAGGTVVSEEDYHEAMSVHRPALQALYAATFEKHRLDALVFPATPLPAQPIAASDVFVSLNGRNVPTFQTFVRSMTPCTIAGVPSVTLPAGLTSAGLPVGLNFDGRRNGDRDLLAVAAAVEAILGPLPPPR